MLTTHRDLDRTFARMDRLMSDLWGTTWTPAARVVREADLRVDIVGYDDHYELLAEVPGLTSDDVTLTAQDGTLTLQGERKIAAPEGLRPLARERLDFKFERRFRMPADVDWDHVTASVKNGLLTVALPKVPRATPRRISVESA